MEDESRVLAGNQVSESLTRMNRLAVTSPSRLREIFAAAQASGAVLRGPRGFRDTPATFSIERIEGSRLALSARASDVSGRRDLLLSFQGSAGTYSFLGKIAETGGKRVVVEFPDAVYLSDRRERLRRSPESSDWTKLAYFRGRNGELVEGVVRDVSGDGLAVEVDGAGELPESGPFEISVGGPRGRFEQRWAMIRHVQEAEQGESRRRLGLQVSAAQPGPLLTVERRKRILEGTPFQKVRRGARVARGTASALRARLAARARRRDPVLPKIEVVDYRSSSGERLRGLLDSYLANDGALGVVVPSAWGRTKETLLPLARTIVENFEAAGRPVVVLRFDGVRRRGESYNEPGTEEKDRQNLYFTVSQGVRDIEASADFLVGEFGVERLVLVTFSASAVEGRRALAQSKGTRHEFAGWISVVGAPDLQSGLRSVSGGIDYFGGAERGMRFGVQEVMGVRIDMDRTAGDALEHKLAFLEDAKRDFARIDTPILWIHGRHDAWLDLERVRRVLSTGKVENRRIIEVATGHQLRSSREALNVFQLVAMEAAKMGMGVELQPVFPNLIALERRRQAERQRLKEGQTSLRRFWRSYLLGRDGSLGIELMCATQAYREFMDLQVRALNVQPGERIVDLGSGTGSFQQHLLGRNGPPDNVTVDSIDLVPEALRRARDRSPSDLRKAALLNYIAGDLGDEGVGFPIREQTYDGAIASLFLSYVPDPLRTLMQIHRMLKPNGRVVLSAMKRDADVSQLFVRGREELVQDDEVGARLGSRGSDLDRQLRAFLNDAAKILELEDEGRFQFWDAPELRRLAIRAGFTDVRTVTGFGSPPQAVVLWARRS